MFHENRVSTPLSYFLARISNQQFYAFSRYGDGEWNCMAGKQGHNTDRHQYFPSMKDDLVRSLFGPEQYGADKYLMGMQQLGYSIHTEFIDRKMNQIPFLHTIPWHNADVFVYASIAGQLGPLFKVLNKTRMILIGPAYLSSLGKYIPIWHHIVVPDIDCYLDKERIKREILAWGKPGVYGFSCSMLAEPLIYELFPLLTSAYLIDFGSLWDPFVDHPTRRYHHNMPAEIRERNLTF